MEIKIGENTSLKTIEMAHNEPMFNTIQQNRQRLREWMGWLDKSNSPEDTANFCEFTIKLAEDDKCHAFGVWVDGEYAGTATQNKIDWVNKACEIGYWIGLKYQGKGLIRAAVTELLRISFEEQELNRVEIRAAVENKRSRKIPESLGFSFEGILRQREWLYDHYVDHAVYSLLKNEWK